MAIFCWEREVRIVKRATHVLLTTQTVDEFIVNNSAKIGFEPALALLPAEAVRRPVEILQNLLDNIFTVLSAVKSVRPTVPAEGCGRVDPEHFIKPGPIDVLEAIQCCSLFPRGPLCTPEATSTIYTNSQPRFTQIFFTSGGNANTLIRTIHKGLP